MKIKTTVLLLAVVLSACHRDQGTTSTTSSSPTPYVYSVEYYMNHKTQRRERKALCEQYKKDPARYDKNCQNARDASLGVGDF
jgi:hypothetical protein